MTLLHPLRSTLFPYTTLFRSRALDVGLIDRERNPDLYSRGQEPGRVQDDVGAGHAREDLQEVLAEPEVVVRARSEEHTSELQSLRHLVCRLLLEKKNRSPTST